MKLKGQGWRGITVKAGTIMVLAMVLFILIPLPKPLFNQPYATTLNSAEGVLLSASIASDQQWRFPPADSIPEKFRIAIKLFEDEYYDYHFGVNPISLIRAIYQNIQKGEVVSGGSTLTMQTIRLAFGNKPRTYTQKLLEIASAVKLELLFSKEYILKAYTNHAPFGGNIVGLNAAAWRYYGRPSHQLSWAESASLAILPNNPGSIYPGRNQDILTKKRNRLLKKIHSRGFIDEDELFLAMEEPLPGVVKPIPDRAYHLLHRSIQEGHGQKELTSTINAQLQESVGRLVNEYSRKMASNYIHNAAALVVEIESGATIAYIGNTENKGDHGQHVDIITSRRSPGSLLKPILYAAALDDGMISPRQLLPDIPVFYKGFAPKNFDKEYRGAVHADDALVSSLNVPFVHLLIDYGYEKFHQKLLDIGFTSFDKPAGHYGLSMILGGAETSLWQLTGVYSSMARALLNHDSRPYHKGYSPEDYHENIYLNDHITSKAAEYSSDGLLRTPSIAYTIEAMQRVQRPDEETGWENFQSSRRIAWKTGTSYGFRDGWAIGINDKYVVGVWIGNADGEGRPGLTGTRAASPLLFKVFDLLEGNAFTQEPYGMPHEVCRSSGMLASPDCPATYKMSFTNYMLQAPSCSFHKILHLNHEETFRVNSSCYEVASMVTKSWFVLPPVQAWYYRKYHPNYKRLPPFHSSCRQNNSKVDFGLIYPAQFSKVHIPIEQDGQKGQVIFEAAHQDPETVVFWHLDHNYLGFTQGTHSKGIQASPGLHTITLIDKSGNEVNQLFEVVE